MTLNEIAKILVTSALRIKENEIVEVILTGEGWGGDAFIARFESDGNLVSVRHVEGPELDVGYGIELSTVDDTLLVTGIVQEQGTFAPGETNETLLTAGGHDMFVAKYLK